MDKNYIECVITIKQEKLSYISDWKQRQAKNKELRNKLAEDFYVVINAIVSAGGVIQMDKYHLDSEWRMINQSISIKIPESKFSEISALPLIETCKKK